MRKVKTFDPEQRRIVEENFYSREGIHQQREALCTAQR